MNDRELQNITKTKYNPSKWRGHVVVVGENTQHVRAFEEVFCGNRIKSEEKWIRARRAAS